MLFGMRRCPEFVTGVSFLLLADPLASNVSPVSEKVRPLRAADSQFCNPSSLLLPWRFGLRLRSPRSSNLGDTRSLLVAKGEKRNAPQFLDVSPFLHVYSRDMARIRNPKQWRTQEI